MTMGMNARLYRESDENFCDLLRNGRQLLFDDVRHNADVLHLLDLFWVKLDTKLLLNGEYQVQVLRRIPALDGLGRGSCNDLVRRDSENVRCNSAHLFKDAQFFPPPGETSLIHSGQRKDASARSSVQKAPSPLASCCEKPCCA